MTEEISKEDIDAEQDELKIAYVRHPISTKEKKAILRKYDKVVDAKFSPDGEPNVILERQKKEAAAAKGAKKPAAGKKPADKKED